MSDETSEEVAMEPVIVLALGVAGLFLLRIRLDLVEGGPRRRRRKTRQRTKNIKRTGKQAQRLIDHTSDEYLRQVSKTLNQRQKPKR
jgi:hypothetical protein